MKHTFKFLIVSILLTFLINVCFSQDNSKGAVNLKIKTINTGKKMIKDPLIKIFENGQELKTITDNPCKVSLNPNKIYTISVSAKEYGSKYICIDTSVPDNLADLICPYHFKVMLDNSESTYDKPAVKIYFGEKDFEFEKQ